MEYQKYIKRLVLGYLKNECKQAYKVFLKYNFHRRNKHIATRVAGQSLEDILKIYSRIQEIIQGRLEDTDYYINKRKPDFLSPNEDLADQLIYLLENSKGLTPASTPCPRSPGDSSVVESFIEHEGIADHTSDIETTPEHLLPGNIATSTEDESNQTVRQTSRSPIYKTPHVNKLPTSEVISEVMSQKLLENVTFQKKLANAINTVRQSPDTITGSEKIEADKNNLNVELNETVKTVLKRTEEDPIFDEMISFLMGTNVGDIANKTSTLSTMAPTSSYNTVSYESSQNKNNGPFTENSNVPDRNVPVNEMGVKNGELQESFDILNQASSPKTTVAGPAPCQNQMVSSISTSQSQHIINTTPNSIYVLTQPQPVLQQPQQLYVLNQPYVALPQTQPTLIQVGQSCVKPLLMPTQPNIAVKPFKEQEIMSMPTIFINDRNEITTPSVDASNVTATQLKVNEVCNVQEYLTLYGATDQSPIIKASAKKPRRSNPPRISPMPTVRIEFRQRDVNETKVDPPLPEPAGEAVVLTPVNCTELPNLNESIVEVSAHQTNSEDKIASQSQKDLPSTPPPVASALRKNTPKSSSHVRNLTFPSPLKRTPSDKTDTVKSPSTVNKKQATKDLFKENTQSETANVKNDSESKQLSEELTKPDIKGKKASEKEHLKTPKKQNRAKLTSWNKGNSWDANLRKMVESTITTTTITEECSPTPIKRIKMPKNSNYIENNSEDILKTPNSKTSKLRRKSLNKSIDKTPKEIKSEVLVQQEVVEKHLKQDPKILSPSTLKANKRNLLTSDIDNVTPENPKDLAQYPVSSRKKRNINQLLESPAKDVCIPPTTGDTPGKLDTPFTPMLKANLKDFAAGDNIYSIDTPNFPITPGFSIIAHTSDYYIPKANETDKVTEAIVVLEEKKSSVRSTDTEVDDEYDCVTMVYGARDILDNFNKSRAGKKNLELLDKKTISWDLNSDKDDKSENGENGDELHSIGSTAQTSHQSKHIKTILPKKSRTQGKHMDLLKSELLPEEIHDNSQTEFSNESCIKDSDIKSTEKPESNFPTKNQTTEIIRNAINNAKFDIKLNLMSYGSLNEKLEEKKERSSKYSLRNTPGRANSKLQSPGRIHKNKKVSPRQTAKATKKITKELARKSDPSKGQLSDVKENSNVNETEDVMAVEQFKEPYSQDEFFQKSGTNLHRKNKEADNSSSDLTVDICVDNGGDCNKDDNETPENNSLNHQNSISGKNSQKFTQDNLQNKDGNDRTSESGSDINGSFDICCSYSENASYVYDEQNPPEKKLEDYDLSRLCKTLLISVPLSDGKQADIVCSLSPFETLLDIKSSLTHDASETDGANKNTEQFSDYENIDDAEDTKKSRKRKRRSESCSSNSSGKKSKVKVLLNQNNIENLLTKIHGPS